jgi:hypothetical protein
MTHLRRVLAPLAAIWLFSQIGTVALVPVALWITTADPHAAECTCGHGPGGLCPMHHKPAGESAPCAMRAANSSGTAVLNNILVGTAGLVPEPPRSIEPALPSARARTFHVRVVDEHPVPPDPPPPRV